MDERIQTAYGGYGRYICVLASRADEDAFLPILAEFRRRRYRIFCDPQAKRGKMLDKLDAASAVVVFVSANLGADSALRDAVAYASCLGKPLISVYLDDAALPEGLAMLLNSRQALFLSDYAEMDAFFEKLFSSKTIRNMRVSRMQSLRRFRAFGGVVRGLLALAAVLLLLAALLVANLLRPFEKQTMATAEAAEATAQGNAQSGASQAAAQTEPVLPGTPLTLDEMDTIQGVWIIGAQFVSSDGSFNDPQQSASIPRGNIGDLGDLAQFPNLTSVRLYRQSGQVDISPLFQCKKLRRVYLNDVQIQSLDGIEQMRELSVLSLVDCGKVDLSPLAGCDFTYAERESGGFRMALNGTRPADYASLGKVKHYKSLTTDAPVTALAPALQDCRRIDELTCTNVGAMSAFSELSCVLSLTVEDSRVTTLAGMEGLSRLESLTISDNLRHIGNVGVMPNVTSIVSGAATTNGRRANPITSIDGLMEAFPNLTQASFPNLTDAENAKLAAFLLKNQSGKKGA